MEGSRPPSGADRDSFQRGSATLLDDVFYSRAYKSQQRAMDRPEKRIGDKLGDVIAGEVVPRLMLLHASGRTQNAAAEPAGSADLSGHIADFADLVIHHERDVIEAYVNSLLQRGLDLETLLMHLLAPAARRLGALWEEDKIDFVDVTIGTSRLQQLLHQFTYTLRKDNATNRRRALFIPAPGEQHTFGLVMVSELFRRAGWRVDGSAAMERTELHPLVSDESFALIGFSVSCDRLINSLCSTIQRVRRLSINKSVLIMVGGRIFAQDPSLRPWVGADLVAANAHDALELAERALRKSAVRRGSHPI